jgi:hypothetical protein
LDADCAAVTVRSFPYAREFFGMYNWLAEIRALVLG